VTRTTVRSGTERFTIIFTYLKCKINRSKVLVYIAVTFDIHVQHVQ
jgi:hypothetical protein